jgi:hypothetical protein
MDMFWRAKARQQRRAPFWRASDGVPLHATKHRARCAVSG